MIEIVICTILIYLLYYFISVSRYDKNGHIKVKKKDNKISKINLVDDYMGLPSEVKYFVKKYNIDLEKINIRGLLKLVGLILALDISVLVICMSFIDNTIYQMLLAAVLIIPVYMFSMKFLSKIFIKKGLVKNNGNKRNRK